MRILQSTVLKLESKLLFLSFSTDIDSSCTFILENIDWNYQVVSKNEVMRNIISRRIGYSTVLGTECFENSEVILNTESFLNIILFPVSK